MFIRIILAEMEERISPYASNAQEVDLCSSGSDGRKYCFVPKRSWPLARIVKVLPSDDGTVRKVFVRVHRDGKNVEYTKPITELVLLVDNYM